MMPLWVRVRVKKDMVKFMWERLRSLYLLGAVSRDDVFKGQAKVDGERAAQRVEAG